MYIRQMTNLIWMREFFKYYLYLIQYSTITKTWMKGEEKVFVVQLELPEKVIFAVDIAVPNKTLFCQAFVAVGTLQAFRVPVLVQHLVNEPVQDHQTTTGAFGYRGCNTKILILERRSFFALDDVWLGSMAILGFAKSFGIRFFKRSVGAYCIFIP